MFAQELSMFIPHVRTALACAVLGGSVSAVAEEDAVINLDKMVVSAAGYEQKITEASASISVVSGEELTQKRFSNLAQALEDVEGIDVRQGTGKTGGLNISMRGMPSEYTLILVDGRRQNSAGNITPNGFGDMNTSFLPPLSAIERIEVIRGPMSTLYGSDAMGGVVNIITKKVATTWGGSITTDYTLQEDRDYGDSQKTSIYATGTLVEGLLGLAVKGSYLTRDESDLRFADGSVVSRRGPAAVEGSNSTLGARLSFTPNANHDLSLEFERGRQVFNNDNCQLGTLDGYASGSGTVGCASRAPNTISGYQDEIEFTREQYSLMHTGRFALGTWDSSLTHSTTEQQGRTIPGQRGVAYTGYPNIVGGNARTLESTDLVLDSKFVMPLLDAHMLTLGGQWWDAEVRDGIASEKFQQSTWALFVENEWRIRDDLALTLGARYDDHETFGGHVSPRAYLVWNTSDHWTLKGGVSKGYKTPSVNELHDGINGVTGQGSTITIGSPDLEPETSVSTELGVYYDNYSGFNANATLFHTSFKDKIESGPSLTNCFFSADPNQPGCVSYGSSFKQEFFAQSVNVGEATTKGLELASRWNFAPAWSLSGNYTFTNSEQKSGDNAGARLTNTPRHMLNASLNWQASERLGLWFKGEYRSERERFLDRHANLSAANKALDDQVGKLKAYEVFHLGGAFQATDNLTLTANLYNLFDKDFLGGEYYRASNGSSAWASHYSQSAQSTTGFIEEGRRLWLSANLTF
jgi:outer membrane receptor for ferrienterochelin and colicins